MFVQNMSPPLTRSSLCRILLLLVSGIQEVHARSHSGNRKDGGWAGATEISSLEWKTPQLPLPLGSSQLQSCPQSFSPNQILNLLSFEFESLISKKKKKKEKGWRRTHLEISNWKNWKQKSTKGKMKIKKFLCLPNSAFLKT